VSLDPLCGFYFDHYLILPNRKENGLTPTIEEYNYDYYATGKVARPPIMEKFEDEVAKVYQVRRDLSIKLTEY
jgi:hypothetical protein